MKNLHNWVFNFNTYTNLWGATTRENYQALFNDRKQGVVQSKSINTLIELIGKTNGDNLKIEKLLK